MVADESPLSADMSGTMASTPTRSSTEANVVPSTRRISLRLVDAEKTSKSIRRSSSTWRGFEVIGASRT